MNRWLMSGSGATGLVLGLASINGYTRGKEGLLSFVVIVCAAFVIARLVAARHFANGLLAGFLGALVAIIVIAASKSGFWAFLCNNPEIAIRLQSGPGETERAQVFLLELRQNLTDAPWAAPWLWTT